MINIKNKILNYFPFIEVESNKLVCRLKDGSKLLFLIYQQGKSVDLVRQDEIGKESSIILGFSFDNEEDVSKLKMLIKDRMM